MQNLYVIPGFEKQESFKDDEHKLLMELLLVSLPSWDERWENWNYVNFRKKGGVAHVYESESPRFFLEKKWLQGKKERIDTISSFRSLAYTFFNFDR